MRRVRVKVCGITSPDAARHAVWAGADALGLLFAPSPRRVSIETAHAIRQATAPFVDVVGVFVNAPVDDVLDTIENVRLTAVQLHGEESPDYVEDIRARSRVTVIKALRVRSQASLQSVSEYLHADAFLFDAFVEGGAYGGTGHTFNWDLVNEAQQTGLLQRPWILAGGLNPENVEEAIRRCGPYAVDVSSGVEASPGVKDKGRVEQFLRRVRRSLSE